MKVQWKQRNVEGDYEVVHFETAAELVKYSDTTVAKVLDDAPQIKVSEFMSGVLTAKTAAEIRQLLQIGVETFYDETGARWGVTQAYLTAEQAKFGTNSAYFGGSAYLRRGTYITLGGSDFSIAGWFYAPKTASAAQPLFTWGDTTNRLAFARSSSQQLYFAEVVSSTTNFSASAMTNTVTMPTAEWVHLEADYSQADGKIYFFANGQLVSANTVALPQTAAARPFHIGTNPKDTSVGFAGYVGEFLITKKLLHIDNFTPPSAPYELDDDTAALLHFQ